MTSGASEKGAEDDSVTLMREASLQLCLPPRLDSGMQMRQAVRVTLGKLGAGHEETADMLLAASEAVNNAICHGSMGSEDHLWVAVEATDCELVVTLEYRGEPFAVAPPALPEITETHGRGRYLMEQLMDRVTYVFDDHWTRTELRKRIQGR